MEAKPFSKFLNVRMTPDIHKAFHLKAQRYGKPSEVLRELVQAFIDDRLVISPNPRKESLYVNRK